MSCKCVYEIENSSDMHGCILTKTKSVIKIYRPPKLHSADCVLGRRTIFFLSRYKLRNVIKKDKEKKEKKR